MRFLYIGIWHGEEPVVQSRKSDLDSEPATIAVMLTRHAQRFVVPNEILIVANEKVGPKLCYHYHRNQHFTQQDFTNTPQHESEPAKAPAERHFIEFTEEQWDEIDSMAMLAIEGQQIGLTMRQWKQVAYISLGKSQRVAAGDYDMSDEDDNVNPNWAEDLNRIAQVILHHFPLKKQALSS